MQLFQMIWNGIGGLGAGTVLLKALFIIILGAMFWVFCELVKYVVQILSKLGVQALRYLAIVVRGWPRNAEEEGGKQEEVWSPRK